MGDELMATGEVKCLHARFAVPVLVVGFDGRPRWSDVFQNNPKILRAPNNRTFQRLINGPNARPYVAMKSKLRWTWKRYQPTPGELHFDGSERAFAAEHRRYVFIEPNVKRNGHANKAWPWERWQALVRAHPPWTFVQCGPDGTHWLEGVKRVETPTFRYACAVLGNSRGFVGAEGGMHHAAAALGVPAVVLYSEFIAPEFTGYRSHRNIRHAGPACGSRVPCGGCEASMRAIEVDEVAHNLGEILH